MSTNARSLVHGGADSGGARRRLAVPQVCFRSGQHQRRPPLATLEQHCVRCADLCGSSAVPLEEWS